MDSALQRFSLRHPVAGLRATGLTNVKPPAAARAYSYAGPEHAGAAGIHKDPAMSYTPDNAQLLNAMQNVMVISTTDLQGNITYANDLFCTLTGFAREELIGQPHSIVRHPDVPKAVYKDMWDTIKAGKTWTGIVPNLGKGGVLYVVDTTVQPLFDADGNITSYISIRRVVNDLMQNYDLVEFSKEKFDDFYEAA
ncbi:PAS sensor protein [Stenotrophomonas maltophilia]|nr:PAS sensor protein [Stenotrophomonas maltophilia]